MSIVSEAVDGAKRADTSDMASLASVFGRRYVRDMLPNRRCLILLALLLGATVSGVFYLAAALVGAGLVLAGATGTCALAGALRRMPWNRSMAARS